MLVVTVSSSIVRVNCMQDATRNCVAVSVVNMVIRLGVEISGINCYRYDRKWNIDADKTMKAILLVKY